MAVAQGFAQSRGQQQAYANQKRAVRAQRRAQRDAYNRSIEQQNREWNNTLKIWNQRVEQYHAQVKRNNDAAYGFGGAYMGLQVRTNEKFTEAAFQNQAALGKLYKTLGTGAASGQSGRSVDRFDVQSLAAFGREQATVASNLTRTREGQMLDAANVRRQLENANNQAYSAVSVAPVPGRRPAPPVFAAMPAAPSSAGIWTNAALGVVGAAAKGGIFGTGAQDSALGLNPGSDYTYSGSQRTFDFNLGANNYAL
jgi:hypothetical protein